jgi:DNA repair protein RadA/Sms
VRVTEPALDLGIALAVVSALRDVPAPAAAVVFGEVGLAGELRAVTHAERRAIEASRLGFEQCVMPKTGADRLKNLDGQIAVNGASTLRAAVEAVLPDALRGKGSEGRSEGRRFNRSQRNESTPAAESEMHRALVTARTQRVVSQGGIENDDDALFETDDFDDTEI